MNVSLHRRSLLIRRLSSFILLLCLAPVLAQSAPPGGDLTGAELSRTIQVKFSDSQAPPWRSVIYAENLQDLPITVTVTPKELVNTEAAPTTVTVPGRSRRDLIHLTPRDPNARYSFNYDWHCTWGSLSARHDPAAVYRLPFNGTYRVVQGFHGPFSHTGDNEYAVDFDLPEGTRVLAAREGTVVRVQVAYTEGGVEPRFWTRSNSIHLEHPDGTLGEYVHLKPGGAAVKPGDRVKAGDLLGFSGNTGYSQSPHLHFYVYRAVDGFRRESFPIRFLVKGKAVEPVYGEAYTSP